MLGRGMARFSEALRTLSADLIMQPGSDEHELAHRFATVAQEQLPLTRDWLQHVFTMHFRQMLRNEAVTLQERTSRPRRRAHAGDRVRRPRRLHRAGGERVLGGAGRRGLAAAAAGRRRGPVAGAARQDDRRRGDARLPRAEGHARDGAASWSRAPRRPRRSRRCGRGSPTAPRSTSGATGSAARSTSPAGSPPAPARTRCSPPRRSARRWGGRLQVVLGRPKKLKGFSSPVKTFRVRRPD